MIDSKQILQSHLPTVQSDSNFTSNYFKGVIPPTQNTNMVYNSGIYNPVLTPAYYWKAKDHQRKIAELESQEIYKKYIPATKANENNSITTSIMANFLRSRSYATLMDFDNLEKLTTYSVAKKVENNSVAIEKEKVPIPNTVIMQAPTLAIHELIFQKFTQHILINSIKARLRVIQSAELAVQHTQTTFTEVKTQFLKTKNDWSNWAVLPFATMVNYASSLTFHSLLQKMPTFHTTKLKIEKFSPPILEAVDKAKMHLIMKHKFGMIQATEFAVNQTQTLLTQFNAKFLEIKSEWSKWLELPLGASWRHKSQATFYSLNWYEQLYKNSFYKKSHYFTSPSILLFSTEFLQQRAKYLYYSSNNNHNAKELPDSDNNDAYPYGNSSVPPPVPPAIPQNNNSSSKENFTTGDSSPPPDSPRKKDPENKKIDLSFDASLVYNNPQKIAQLLRKHHLNKPNNGPVFQVDYNKLWKAALLQYIKNKEAVHVDYIMRSLSEDEKQQLLTIEEEETILHAACHYGDEQTVSIVMYHLSHLTKAMLTQRDRFGYTPLHRVAEYQSSTTLNALLQYSNSTQHSYHLMKQETHDGLTPLELAITALDLEKLKRIQIILKILGQEAKTIFEQYEDTDGNQLISDLVENGEIKAACWIELYRAVVLNCYSSLTRYQNLMRQHNIEEFDFSSVELNSTLLAYLKRNLSTDLKISIIKVVLQYCGLNDSDVISSVAQLLTDFSNLKHVDLAHNFVGFDGAQKFLRNLETTTKLPKLNLEDNHVKIQIGGCNQLLKTATSKVEKVKISQNFLDEECTPYFEKSNNKPLSNSYRYQFFVSKPKEIQSRINPQYSITSDEGLVFLVSKKEHAMIYVEGMHSNGQRFLYQIHIRATKSYLDTFKNLFFHKTSTYAEVEVNSEGPKKINLEQYDVHVYPNIPRAKLLKLKNEAEKEQKNGVKIPFLITATSETENCLTWAIKKLESIGINDARTWKLPLPSLGIRLIPVFNQ